MQIIAINYSLKIWIPLSERWRNLAFQSVLRRRNFFIQSESLTKQTSFYDFEKLIQRKKIQRFSGFLYYVMVRVVPTTYKDGINLIEIGVIYSIIWLYVDLSRLYFIKIYSEIFRNRSDIEEKWDGFLYSHSSLQISKIILRPKIWPTARVWNFKKKSQFFSSRILLKIFFVHTFLKKFKLTEALSRAAAAPPEQPP